MLDFESYDNETYFIKLTHYYMLVIYKTSLNKKQIEAMKKIQNILAICLLCVALPMSAQRKTLTILHTNDTHSCIYPLSENLVDTMLAGRGGFMRRIEMLKQERKKDPDLLLFDSGDFSQGSPYYTLFKGDVEVKLMNEMHYDAGMVGNHEFDFGLENLARLAKMMNFPMLCANYDFKGTVCEGIIKPYTIIKRKGIKIGVFALSPEIEGLIDAKNCVGVKFLDPVKVANEMETLLKKKKHCDLIICLSHVGWLNKPICEQNIIAHSRYIDLMLGGHSHTYFKTLRYVKNLDGKPIPVDQNGKYAIFVGKMKVEMEKK